MLKFSKRTMNFQSSRDNFTIIAIPKTELAYSAYMHNMCVLGTKLSYKDLCV